MPEQGELTAVLLDRLGPQTIEPLDPQVRQGRIELLRRMRARRAKRRRAAVDLDPDVAELFGLVAGDPADFEHLIPELTDSIRRARERGAPRDSVTTIFQAYVRAVGRVAAAEAEAIRATLEALPADEQPARLAEALDDLLPVGGRSFDVLRRMFLLDALVDALATMGDDAADEAVLAVGMVDLVASTRYLARTDGAELSGMVDALFAAGQAATARRSAYVVKYVGDGLFVAGRDVATVADAALEVVERLESALPLRARGGLSCGPVTQRAGDVFGLPINLAHHLTKVARPGMLVADESAASALPAARRGRWRTVEAHPVFGSTRVATVKAGR